MVLMWLGFDMTSVKQLLIDPGLWQGASFAERLAGHFSDILPWQAFLAFASEKRAAGIEVQIFGLRRQFNRYGEPVLLVDLSWRGEPSRWRFVVIGAFVDPVDDTRYLVFDARLPRIALNIGYAMAEDIYYGLNGPVGMPGPT